MDEVSGALPVTQPEQDILCLTQADINIRVSLITNSRNLTSG
ncbi:unnamed protein product [marine sediment metagenome]|uniref:Uncharacterized protein n=1 Tax=marine sediment metagenome TaxID=412755 RepID=X1SI25_9ZZZZ